MQYRQDGSFKMFDANPVVAASSGASAEKQVAYLKKCIHLKDSKIKGLELEIETMKLDRELEEIEARRQEEALLAVTKRINRIKSPPVGQGVGRKKSFWRRWFKK